LNRITRTTIALLATVAASVGSVALPGVAQADVQTVTIGGVVYEDRGVVPLDDGLVESVNAAVDLVLQAAKGVSCVPKTTSSTIYDPSAHVYYGTLDSIYVWDDLGEAAITGCPDNTVTVKVQMLDQALDGTSAPATSGITEGSGKARAGAIASMMQRYSNIAMSTGLSYHQLTTSVTASQTDGKTTTAWCAKKSWTYIATVAGPSFVGSTPTEKVKCGA